MPRARGDRGGKDTVTDFVDPLEEPLDQDRDPRRPLDPDVEDALVDSADADRQAAEAGTLPGDALDDPADRTSRDVSRSSSSPSGSGSRCFAAVSCSLAGL